MEESIIYLAQTEDRIAFVNSILGMFQKDFTSSVKVLVKPNIVSGEAYPTTTHLDVLISVLDFLIYRGSQIVVADGPAVDAGRSGKIISNHPLAEICCQRGIQLQNLHKHGFKKVRAESMTLEVSALVFESDYIISLPVLKPHQHCYMTGAIKNQFGFLRNRERIMMHTRLKNIHRGIAEVNSVVRPNLFIMDAVSTYKRANERRHGGSEVKLGYMLAGKDPIALDSLGLELLKNVDDKLIGMNPENVPYIEHSIQLGLGSTKYRIENY